MCMCICMCLCMGLCIYMCIRICIHVHTHQPPMSEIPSNNSRTSSAVPAGQHCIQALQMVTIRREFLHFPSGVLPLPRHAFRASTHLSFNPLQVRRPIHSSLFFSLTISRSHQPFVFTRYYRYLSTVYLPYHSYLSIPLPSISLALAPPPHLKSTPAPLTPPPSPSTHTRVGAGHWCNHGAAAITSAARPPLPW